MVQMFKTISLIAVCLFAACLDADRPDKPQVEEKPSPRIVAAEVVDLPEAPDVERWTRRSKEEWEAFEAFEKWRVAKGLRDNMRFEQPLYNAARQHAQFMASTGRLGHAEPEDGQKRQDFHTVWNRASRFGFGAYEIAEVLAYGYDSPQDFIVSVTNTEETRETMLMPEWHQGAIAIVEDLRGAKWFVLVLANNDYPSNEEPRKIFQPAAVTNPGFEPLEFEQLDEETRRRAVDAVIDGKRVPDRTLEDDCGVK